MKLILGLDEAWHSFTGAALFSFIHTLSYTCGASNVTHVALQEKHFEVSTIITTMNKSRCV